MIKQMIKLVSISFVAALLMQSAFAQTPGQSVKITAHSNPAYEGSDVNIHFKMQGTPDRATWKTCYSYETADGTATLAERDYRAKSGVVCWERYTRKSGTVSIQALQDFPGCECNETVKVVLSNPRAHTRRGWGPACGAGGPWPCSFTAEATIKQPAGQCRITPVCD